MRNLTFSLAAALLTAACLCAQTATEAALAKPIIDPKQPMVEAQVYLAAKVLPMPSFRSAEEWRAYATKLRRRILDEVVYRGEAKKWRDAPLHVEWLDTIHGGSDYEIRKLRIEAVPGFWIAGLLYKPLHLTGKTPAVLNLNGHEKTGKATPYIQERCIHLARSGVLALNLEWLGRGQMTGDGYHHYRMPQIDLTGSSGEAVFYLSMRKGLDLLESLPETDRARIAVTGLSGGGWQTVFLSALDERVALANPVAGFSSFVTKTQWPATDLGDAEQTPSDLASIADYTHLAAMLAPRWTQISNNAKDNCCFRADYALGPVVQAVRPIFALMGAPEHFRYHVNFGEGHNYDAENREAFYRLLRDGFYGGKTFPIVEKPLESPVRTAAELNVELPADNLDFNTLALRLAQGLPHTPKLPAAELRKKLRSLVRAKDYTVDARSVDMTEGDPAVRRWQLKMDGAWTVPAVEFTPANPTRTAIVVADAGRKSAAAEIEALVASGARVLAIDPFYFGESKIASHDYLFAILAASLGDRPLGLQASQLMAAARWLKREHPGQGVELIAFGPRTSLMALIAGALETGAIGRLELHHSFSSLHEILEQNMSTDRTPELLCFGLLESFDIQPMAALVAPREVVFVK